MRLLIGSVSILPGTGRWRAEGVTEGARLSSERSF